jgi:trehalose 6-phosphate synthase/phosphatase
MERARALLAEVSAETPGALVEQKTTSLAWHYRMVEPSLAARQLQRVKAALPDVLGSAPVELLEGHMVLELRPRGVSKALVVRCLTSRVPHSGSIVVIGDDRTDEEMFALPRPGVSIRVGPGETRAAYRLADPAAVRRFLTGLTTLVASPSPRPNPVPLQEEPS